MDQRLDAEQCLEGAIRQTLLTKPSAMRAMTAASFNFAAISRAKSWIAFASKLSAMSLSPDRCMHAPLPALVERKVWRRTIMLQHKPHLSPIGDEA